MHQQADVRRQKHASTCLIVEDSHFDQQMMTRVINRTRKMRVEVASTIEAARRALARGHVSLILLDNNLPDGIGANFAMELAQSPTMADIPIIMVSDWPTPFMWEKAAAAGVLYVVNKAEFGTEYVEQAMRDYQAKKRQRIVS